MNDYALSDFDGTASSLVVDPTDPTNTVVQTTKNAGQVWAGTVVGNNGFSAAMPLTATDTLISVRVWSPDANIPVRFKIEDAADPTINVETETNTTVAGAWETLVFNVKNHLGSAFDPANTYDKAVMFFDFGTNGTGKVYYWDDMMIAAPVVIPDSVDVTFRVDMSNADSIASDGIFLAGSFNGWNDGMMTDVDNDSVYEVTVTLVENTDAQFKFKNGANVWESINLSFDSTCVAPDGSGNRLVMVGASDMTLTDYCFNACVTCDIVSPTAFVPVTASFEMMPNPANSYVQLVFNEEFTTTEKTVFVFNAVGQTVFTTNVNNVNGYTLNTSTLASGMYFITVQTEDGIQTKRLMVNH